MFAHLLTTVAKLLGAGGAKAIVADSLLMKQVSLNWIQAAIESGFKPDSY